MNMEALMNEALERINRQYGIRLMLEKARPGCVFPKVDIMGCFVRFNPKIRSFLTLYNLMLQFPSIDSESVVFFRLYNLYLDCDAYPKAEVALDQLEKEVNQIIRKIDRRYVNSVTQSVELQMLFILLHESSHALFYYRPEIAAEFLADARRSVEEVQDLYTKGLPNRMKGYMDSMIPDGLPDDIRAEASKEQQEKMRQYGRQIFDFSGYLQSGGEGMLEEFACDHLAWQQALVQYMEKAGMLGEAVLRSNINLLLTLHILDYDKALRSIFTGEADEKQINLVRDAGIRHAALRDCIWHFYKETYTADHSHEFLRQSEERDERAKRLLLCSTFNHASEIIDLRDQPFRLPDEPRINVLEERFAEIEERILEFC